MAVSIVVTYIASYIFKDKEFKTQEIKDEAIVTSK